MQIDPLFFYSTSGVVTLGAGQPNRPRAQRRLGQRRERMTSWQGIAPPAPMCEHFIVLFQGETKHGSTDTTGSRAGTL